MPGVPRLLLVRHAQSTWNAEGRWQGWADPPLSPLGERQAAAAASRLPWAPARWVASDLQRARRSAELLAGAAGAVLTDAGLREYDAGAWTGLRRTEIAERWPDELAAWDDGRSDAAPDGESAAAFRDRLLEALGRVAEAGKDALVVSHGRAIHAVATALGAPDRYVAHLAGLELRTEGADLVPAGSVALVPEDLVAPRVAAPEV